MRVELLHATSLWIAEAAGRICVGNEPENREIADFEYIKKLLNAGHESILEHLTYTFEIRGISRALLQQLARHRHISLSVKSTRWCLDKHTDYYVPKHFTHENDDDYRDRAQAIEIAIESAKFFAKTYGNDIAKYFLPEAVKTDLILTTNLRELRHIYRLRTDKRAMKEFQYLCYAIKEALPEQHQRLLLVGIEPPVSVPEEWVIVRKDKYLNERRRSHEA